VAVHRVAARPVVVPRAVALLEAEPRAAVRPVADKQAAVRPVADKQAVVVGAADRQVACPTLEAVPLAVVRAVIRLPAVPGAAPRAEDRMAVAAE
jgi:hypothetical protein